MKLELLHLCDSLFPIGSFGCSDGLEAAAVRLNPGVADAADRLSEWMDVCLDETLGRLEGPAVGRAWRAVTERDWQRLVGTDEDATALRPSASARQTSRSMGWRLVSTWAMLHSEPRLDQILALASRSLVGPTLPVAFGSVCASSLIPQRETIEAFAYTRLSATISAAMRLMPLGQVSAHTLLARSLERVPAVVSALLARDAEPESFAPQLDIAVMTQQYLHSRLFRT